MSLRPGVSSERNRAALSFSNAKKTARCSRCGHRCRCRNNKRTCRARDLSAAGWKIHLEFERWRVRCPRCMAVVVEQLDWLAKNPRHTQRFAMHVDALCREMTNKAVAEFEHLHVDTVKDLDQIYMRLQIAEAGQPSPRVIGVDEISIRKRHNYRIVVSDLDLGHPIWVGGQGRKEEDLNFFFEEIGASQSKCIGLAAMDMWKPFCNSLTRNAPQARIVSWRGCIHPERARGECGATLRSALPRP